LNLACIFEIFPHPLQKYTDLFFHTFAVTMAVLLRYGVALETNGCLPS